MSLVLPYHKLQLSSPYNKLVWKSLFFRVVSFWSLDLACKNRHQKQLGIFFLLSPAASTSKSPVPTGHTQHDEGELASCGQPRSRTQSHLHHQPRQRRQAGEALKPPGFSEPSTPFLCCRTAASLRRSRLRCPDGGLWSHGSFSSLFSSKSPMAWHCC